MHCNIYIHIYPKAILSVLAFMKICWLLTCTIICWQPLCNTISEDHLERLVIPHPCWEHWASKLSLHIRSSLGERACTSTCASKHYFLPELSKHALLSASTCTSKHVFLPELSEQALLSTCTSKRLFLPAGLTQLPFWGREQRAQE